MRDLTGQRFGRLVALNPTDKRLQRSIVWECACDCGNTAYVSVKNLTQGNTRSCGCLHGEAAKENGEITRRNIIGQRFGMLVAIRPTEARQNKSVVWECKCDCGNTTFVSLRSLHFGNTRSCGCLRVETARSHISNVNKKNKQSAI
jgi:hypothetical protein